MAVVSKAIRMTQRDRQLLADLGLVTVLSSADIWKRHFQEDTTGKSCLRRLRFLTENHLVLPVSITACFGTKNALQTVYRLTPRGADWLARDLGRSVRCLHTDPRPETLLHRLAVSRVILAMNDACQADQLVPPLWLLEHDRWPNAPHDVPRPKQYRLAADFLPILSQPDRPAQVYGPPRYDDPALRLVKARPDAACLLTLPGQSLPLSLFWEVDRGTETLTQLCSKLPGYHAWLAGGTFARSWLDLSDATKFIPRVLFVFRGKDRLESVLNHLTQFCTSLWFANRAYRPTQEDKVRATGFLNQFMRFSTLSEWTKTESLTERVWRTLARRVANELLAISPSCLP